MPNQNINLIQNLFQSRLTTLDRLLKSAQSHFGDNESFLQKRIVAGMFPFGTQIAFTCNQPRNFAIWCEGEPANNLDPDVTAKYNYSRSNHRTRRAAQTSNAAF